MNLQFLHQQIVALSQQGQLTEAERLCRQFIAAAPANAMGPFLLGIIRFQQARFADAVACHDKALALHPGHAAALYNRAFALQRLNRLEDALTGYDAAAAAKPDFAATWNNRGNVLKDLERFEAALESYDRTLKLSPNAAVTWHNRGEALRRLERFDEALESYDAALRLRGDLAEAWNMRAVVLDDLQRIPEALAGYEQALRLDPGLADAWCARGRILRTMKRLDEALESYDRAVAAKPDYVEALSDRGLILSELKRPQEALASCDRALAIDPDHAEALYQRGLLRWLENKDYAAAKGDMARAAAIEPDLDYLRGTLFHLPMQVADWQGLDGQVDVLDAGVRGGKRIVEPFIYQAISDSPADLQACARIYAGHFPPLAGPAVTSRHQGRIRIGYLSGDFVDHPVANLMAGLFERHDREKFEIVAFDNHAGDDSDTRRRLEAAFGGLVGIAHLSDEAAADRIRDAGIDILVNLSGHTARHRMGVFARRAAPVQVNYLGFPGTLGADTIDYIIADRCVIPEDEQRHFTEEIVYLPDTYLVSDSRRPIASAAPGRAESGLPETGFVFCSFNGSYKLTPAVFAVWMRLLRRIEGSVLWLRGAGPIFTDNLRREAEARGVAGARLIFAQNVPADQYLARLSLADLFLDTLPFNAHSTAADALWAGVPLVTCRGKAFAGRVAASLLQAVGLPELVTETPEEYEALALRLATEPALLGSIREKLARNRLTAPLFDTDRFRRHLESAYTTMWDRHRRGEHPNGFAVSPLNETP